MIKFKKVIVEGFGSIVDRTEFKLDRPGLNIVIGKNGAGKTSFFSALRWAKDGYTLKNTKNVNTWKFYRPHTYNGTYVELRFQDDENKYKVIRCSEYKGDVLGAKGNNRLLFLINGEQSPIRDKKPLQVEINRIIGYSNDLFVNTILFGQSLKRIIEETGPNKKKVFEEAFESGFIQDGKDKADKELKLKRPQFQEVEKSRDKLKSELNSVKEIISWGKKQELEFQQNKEETIKNIQHRVSVVKSSLNSPPDDKVEIAKKKLPKLIKQYEDINEYLLQEMVNKEFRQDIQVTNLKGDLEDLINNINHETDKYKGIAKRCFECGNKISKEKISEQKATMMEKIKKLRDKIPSRQTRIKDAEIELEGIKKEIASIKNNQTNSEQLRSQIKHYESVLKVHQAYLNRKEIDKEKYSDLRKELTKAEAKEFVSELPGYIKKKGVILKNLKDNKILYKGLGKEIKDLDWLVSDALGNKGLKSYIFSTMFQGLNDKLRYYEQYIGYRVEFNVDLESGNKDIYTLCYIGEHMIDYNELSGGQMKTINICTAFAMYDLVSGDKPVNLIIFDEVFDSLDAENTDLVMELIREKSVGKSVFLISHNIELQNLSDKVIRMSLNAQHHTVLKTLTA